ncbi:MAG TPA: DUF2334 domain-containing protein [Polyangiaceae bacterium]
MARARTIAGALVLVALTACGVIPAASVPSRPAVAASQGRGARCLILYEDGDAEELGELYATGVGVVASHFGIWTAIPLRAYRRGLMRDYDATVYVGSTTGEPLADDLVDDVLADAAPVVWIGGSVRELAGRAADFGARFGFVPAGIDEGPFHAVSYAGVRLARRTPDGTAGVTTYEQVDPAVARVIAWAERDDGTRVPWALRTGRFTYVGENPLAYVTSGDRYLAFCDMLFDALAPGTPERHRAVIRIEDVTPRSDPAALRAIADRLSARGVPFSVAVVPVFQDPTGRTRMRDAPAVASAIRAMLANGGELVLHGYTHQRTGTTGADIEFSLDDRSEAWATDRVQRALDELSAAGLPRPRMFEYPHYVGSPESSRAIARMIDVSFQRETFFAGTLEGRSEDIGQSLSLLFPFAVRDVYGWRVVPENLDHYVPEGDAAQAPETAEDIVARAQAMRVVRDGVAGFFFHPVYDPSVLERIVDGIAAEGYTFVSAAKLAREVP